jgi:tripartite-type tricarboxylate transporter receptor subunit TctC
VPLADLETLDDVIIGNLLTGLLIDPLQSDTTTIGATAVARAAPDGYTIGFLGSSIPAAQGLGKPLGFDVRDFVPLAHFINLRLGVQVNTSLLVHNLADVVELAKAQPGSLNFASTGFGSAPHIATEIFMQATGTKLTHVPYQSGAVAMQDLVAGRVNFYIDGTSIAIPLHTAGQIRILAVTGSSRTAAAPDLPTMREIGFGRAEYYAWGGWVMPPGTPPKFAKRVSDAVMLATTDDGIRKRFDDVGVELVSIGPAEMATFIKSELAKYQDLATSAHIKFE